MKLLTALTLLLLASQSFADDSNFSTHLFAKFQQKACTRCHDFFEEQRGGLAYGSHRERSVEMCVVCHQQSVTGFEHQEEWYAQPGLYTSAMNARQTCEATMAAQHARFKSRVLLKKQLRKHLLEDPRVLWGIEGATPRSGMLPNGKMSVGLVSGGLTLWQQQVDAWLEGGMKCQ